MRRSTYRLLSALIPVILLWAATPLLVSELSRSLPVLEINFLATVFAAAVLAAMITAGGRWRHLRGRTAADWRAMALLGAIGIFPYTTLYYLAFSLAPEAAGEVNIINYLWPIWIVILSAPLLGEPLKVRSVAGVLLSFAGVYLIVSGGRWVEFRPDRLPAYLSAGCGAFFWALFSVLSKRRGGDPLTSMLVYNLAALLLFGVSALLVSRLSGIPLRPPGGREWGLLALLGGGANGLAYLLWITALRRGDTARVSSAVYLTPFVALVYLTLFGRGTLHGFQLAALALIVAGPLLNRVRRAPGSPREP